MFQSRGREAGGDPLVMSQRDNFRFVFPVKHKVELLVSQNVSQPKQHIISQESSMKSMM